MHHERVFAVLELPKVLARLSAFTVSDSGRRACLALRPFTSLALLRAEADFYTQGQLWKEHSGFKLASFPELDSLWELLENSGRAVDLEGLWAVRQALRQAQSLLESIDTGGTGKAGSPVTDNWPVLKARCAEILLPQSSMQALQRCLSDEGLIKDDASPELKLVRLEIRRLHQQCSKKVKEFANQYNIAHYLQDDFITLSSDRYVLPLKSNFKGRLQGIIHDYSQTGETCYFEPFFLVEINNRLQELKREEREEEHKILLRISALLRDELPGLHALYAFMVKVDVLQAKLELAEKYAGRLVAFEEIPPEGQATEGLLPPEVLLLDARHPLLALEESDRGESGGGESGNASAQGKNRKDSPLRAVPIDIELRAGQKALIISGGNAGGKTVCLKTLGLAALMGMSALPVPVGKGSRLPFWSALHPFIGDEQSLEDHVSTFTAQITNLSKVLSRADSSSLVLLDEFGAGTDPAQGAALAQAVVDVLMEQGAYVVAATHFPALKAYALSRPAVRAASVLFDPDTKRPLFRLAYDQVGASQALDVAREHGLPEKVLKKAEQYLLLDGEDSGALIARLNSLAVEREQELAQLRGEQEKFQARRARLEERFAKEKQQLFEQVQAQAAQVLQDWKSGRSSHKQALKQLSTLRNELARGKAQGSIEEAAEEQTPPPLDIALLAQGQKVHYRPWDRKAQVVDKDSRRQKVRLDINGVTMWVDAADIAELASGAASGPSGSASGSASGSLFGGPLGGKTQPGLNAGGASAGKNAGKGTGKSAGKAEAETGPASGFTGKIEQSYALRLDLRGKRADFAINELAAFLDSAVMSGREVVEVLHGRGTGALRREVHAFLKTFPAVSNFKLAPEDQGGDGVTLIQLK